MATSSSNLKRSSAHECDCMKCMLRQCTQWNEWLIFNVSAHQQPKQCCSMIFPDIVRTSLVNYLQFSFLWSSPFQLLCHPFLPSPHWHTSEPFLLSTSQWSCLLFIHSTESILLLLPSHRRFLSWEWERDRASGAYFCSSFLFFLTCCVKITAQTWRKRRQLKQWSLTWRFSYESRIYSILGSRNLIRVVDISFQFVAQFFWNKCKAHHQVNLRQSALFVIISLAFSGLLVRPAFVLSFYFALFCIMGSFFVRSLTLLSSSFSILNLQRGGSLLMLVQAQIETMIHRKLNLYVIPWACSPTFLVPCVRSFCCRAFSWLLCSSC